MNSLFIPIHLYPNLKRRLVYPSPLDHEDWLAEKQVTGGFAAFAEKVAEEVEGRHDPMCEGYRDQGRSEESGGGCGCPLLLFPPLPSSVLLDCL